MTTTTFDWINVNVELPPNTMLGHSDKVLCAYGEDVILAYYDYQDKMWTQDFETQIIGITHWGYLPPPPRGGDR